MLKGAAFQSESQDAVSNLAHNRIFLEVAI